MSSALSPADYDAWYDSPRGGWIGNTEYRLLSDELQWPSEGRVLDVGCGTGWFTRRLAALPNLQVTGIDVDPKSLAFARSRDARSTYVQANALALPFADNSFDHVLSVAALCFTADWQRAVSEMVRVARRRFVVGLLNRHSLLWLKKGRQGGSGAYRGAIWLSPAEIRDGLKALPVAKVRQRSAIFLPSGSIVARSIERLTPGYVPWGGFVVLSGEKKSTADGVSLPETS
jgi:SAM-dependent methyltransferase